MYMFSGLLAVMVVSVIFAATAAEAKSTDNGSSVCPSVFILSRIDGVIGNSELKAILHIIPKVSKINSYNNCTNKISQTGGPPTASLFLGSSAYISCALRIKPVADKFFEPHQLIV